MDWTRGYTAGWQVMRVNPDTWADDGEVSGVSDISKSESRADATSLLETATLTVEGGVEAGWHRIYLVASQGAPERFAVATVNLAGTKRHVGLGETVEARGRSVLQPAADARFASGSVTPAGADAAAWCAAQLSALTPAPVSAEGSFAFVEDYVHAPNSIVLTQVWKVLSAGGFCIRIAGDGSVSIGREPSAPALELDRAHAGLLVPSVDVECDLTGVPNRYTAVFPDGEQVVAVNEDATSEVGRQARGWWVDAPVDSSPAPVNGESRQAYAERRLAELSVVKRTYRYQRDFWPGVGPYALVKASLPANGLEGDLRVVSAETRRDVGAVVTEVAEMEVRV